MTTKTTSALERLRAYLVGRSGLHQYAESHRTEMREIIAAFEDEQRQHDTALKVAWEDGRENGLADSKPQEAVCSRCAAVFGWTPEVAAFEDEQRQRDERDAKIRKVLLALRGGQYMTVAKGVDEALALLDDEKGGAQ